MYLKTEGFHQKFINTKGMTRDNFINNNTHFINKQFVFDRFNPGTLNLYDKIYF